MIEVGLPRYGVDEIVEEAMVSIQNSGRRKRLAAVRSQLEADEATYLARGGRQEWWRIQPWGETWHTTARVVRWCYENKLVARSSSLRRIYDELRQSTPHGRCPLCQQRVVATLDHYLSRATHPELAVTPANLVPACSDCNKLKLDQAPESAEEQPLHPYFDRLPAGRWLAATVLEETPPGGDFRCEPPGEWDATLRSRLAHHFRVYGLRSLYNSHAGEEIAQRSWQLEIVHAAGGPLAVREHLLDGADSVARASGENHWRAVLLGALADSTWYCNRGFATA